jgi:hypothetical protein
MDILPAIDNLKQGSGRTPLADFFSSPLETAQQQGHGGGSWKT